MKDNNEQEPELNIMRVRLEVLARIMASYIDKETANLKSIIVDQAKEIEELTEAYRSMGEEWHKTEQELEELKKKF